MKILVVGGAGYIGGAMVDTLIKDNQDVTVYDALLYEERFLKRVPFIYGDVRDRHKLLGILPDYEVVIWLAAIVGDGACKVDPYLAQAVNEDSVRWLVDHYDGKIVFTSTCSVYGAATAPVSEESETNPLSVYAETKLAAEQYIMAHSVDYLIFRLGTIYGLGDPFSRVRFDLVTNILTKLAAQGQPLTVFGGEQWRPLLHVKDVGRAVSFGLEHGINGLYNLAEDNYQISDIARMVKAVVPNTEIMTQDIPFEDQRNYQIVKPGEWNGYGWTPKYLMVDGIKEIYKLVKEDRLKDISDNVYSNEKHLGSQRKSI